jgi:hypothetical protein
MMGRLSEVEIFDCLFSNFAEAAEKCEILANHPRRGLVYGSFLKNIKEIEGAALQANTWREDTRWLKISMQMGEVQARVGHWLRNSPTIETRAEVDKKLKRLAEILRMFARESLAMKDKATGKLGMILPEPLPGPHRDTRPVQVRTPGGLILPSGTVLH